MGSSNANTSGYFRLITTVRVTVAVSNDGSSGFPDHFDYYKLYILPRVSGIYSSVNNVTLQTDYFNAMYM